MLISSTLAPASNATARHEVHTWPPAGAGRWLASAPQVLDGLLGLMVFLLAVSSWLTHVVVCAMEGLWTFLVLGVLVFPLALLHGVAVWLGL